MLTLDNPYMTEDWHLSAAVYRDPDIFASEMRQIFGKCWIYVAHETELPDGGDYKRATVGRQPVIVVRGADDGVIRVLYNRCRHRGAAVCQRDRGNSNFFRCAYHGWTYGSDGRLTGVPFPDAYGDTLDKASMGLVPVPKVASYRGFVFACLDPGVAELEEHIGHARPYLDYMADLDIELSSGVQKYKYHGNWKLQLENTIDAYHVTFTHKSWLDILKQRTGSSSGFLEGITSNPDWRTLDLGGGHAALEVGKLQAAQAGAPDLGIGDLIPFNLVLFPTLGFVGSHLRVVQPISVDRTEVGLYPMLPRRATDEQRTRFLRDHEAFYGPSGAGSADDIEVGFERVSRGLAATETTEDWLLISRGLATEEVDPATGIRVGRPADELTQRGFYRRWSELVVADAPS